jgi:tetratricopeptide (TPR) repeat protein
VRGAVVSDHTCYHFLFDAGATGSGDPIGVTHPPELLGEITPLVRRPGDLKAGDLERFVDVPAEDLARPFNFQDDLSHFKWALATAQSYREIGLDLWKQRHPDVEFVYIEGVDSTSHLFGHLFRRSDLSGPLAEQGRRYGHAVDEMYRYADEIVGAYLDALDDRTTLLVLSDHGFELGVLHEDPSRARDLRRVSERFHRIEGILYLYGDRVRAGRRLEKPTILDIAPTVLALSGVSPAADMPGRVLAEGLDLPSELTSTPRSVASYEAPAAEGAAAEAKSDASVSPEILEHLRALGYLDASSPKGDRNLAALHFEKGDYAEAAKLYAELVRESPDDAGLRASYAGALGSLGKLDEAYAELGRAIAIEPANPEAYHNRGAILEKRGDAKGAAREYQTALRYAPDYEPSRKALARLGGAPAGEKAKTPNEKLATALAEQAHQAALRDDFAEATRKLDEAERIAPRFALVAHYRANIAYLQGDRAGAIKALRRAVELEPDNPLFRTNLERLEAPDKGEGKVGRGEAYP